MINDTTENNDLLILPQEDTDTLVMDKEAVNDDIVAPSNNLISFNDKEISLDTNDIVSLDTNDIVSLDTNDIESTSDYLEITEDKEKENKKDLGAALPGEENTSDTLEITENFDLGDFGNLKVEDSIEDRKNEETDLDFGDLSLQSENNSTLKDSVGTMEDILARAMADLDSRFVTIGNEKKSEEDKKSDFKDQITDLQKQIKDIQNQIDTSDEKISELDAEQEMIEKNNKSLEEMKKMNPTNEIKTSTSRKIHNVKRKAA